MARQYGGLNPGKKRKKRWKLSDYLNVSSWIFEIMLVIIIAFVLVRFFGVRTTMIGDAMEPSLKNTDQVFMNEFVYIMTDPKPGEVVVFLPNGNEKSHYYIRRIVGVPGDTIEITGGELRVNGSACTDSFSDISMDYAGLAEGGLTLAEDEYFVLGDNRSDSEDSRYANIGVVKKDYIIGKAWFRFNKLTDLGFIRK